MTRDLTPLPEVVEAFRDLWPHIMHESVTIDHRTGGAEHTIKILIPEGFIKEQELLRHFTKYLVDDQNCMPTLIAPIVAAPGLPVFTGVLLDDGSAWCVLVLWRLWRIKQANKNKLPSSTTNQ